MIEPADFHAKEAKTPEEACKKLMGFVAWGDSTPTRAKVWTAQEELSVRLHILQVINVANNSVARFEQLGKFRKIDPLPPLAITPGALPLGLTCRVVHSFGPQVDTPTGVPLDSLMQFALTAKVADLEEIARKLPRPPRFRNADWELFIPISSQGKPISPKVRPPGTLTPPGKNCRRPTWKWSCVNPVTTASIKR